MSGRQKWGRTRQWDAQRGLCWICLLPMLDASVDPSVDAMAASVDHLVARVRGGSESWRNKLLAHRLCNSERGAPFIWVKLAAFRRAAMARVTAAAHEGVDLGSAVTEEPERRDDARSRGPATVPSKMAGQALRVTLAELASLTSSARSS